MATQQIPGNRLSYYQYGDEVVYNLGKNSDGTVRSWNYFPAGTLGFAPIGGVDFNEFTYLPNGPGTGNLQTSTGTGTGADTEPLDIASMNTAYEKQQAALAKTNNAAEQIKQAQQARVENANTITPEPVETAGRVAGTNTNAIKDPLQNQLYQEPTDAELDAAIAEEAANQARAQAAQPSFDPPTDDTTDPLQTEFVTLEEAGDVLTGAEFDAFQGDEIVSNKDGNEGAGGFGANVQGTDTQSGAAISPLPTQFLTKIEPKDNPLDGFSSYTYSVSIYLVNKTGLQRLQQGIKSVAGLPLIMQSGGAPKQGQADLYGAKRSPYFNLDYYIDDVELEGVVTGISTQSIHNQHTIRFTVTEPYGLTFLDNLHNAVRDYKTSLGFAEEKINYASQMYLMVVRFYGYDAAGQPLNLGQLQGDNRFSEKYIPFIFSGIQFRMENDKIVYSCEGSAPMSFYNLNVTHSSIPFNIELTGGTLGEVLGDPAGDLYTASNFDARTPDGAVNKSTKVTMHTGLTEALNRESEKAYGTEFANRYKIIFEQGAGFENHKITVPGSTNKERTGMKSSKEQPQSGNTDRVNKETRSKSIQAGTSIMQAIEQIVRNSTYITSQQNLDIDERTGKPKPKDKTITEPLQWFKVVMQATPRSDRVNPKTNDYAYDIVYKIKRFAIGNHGSPFFAPPIFRGVHKAYKYWFTGQNTQVLRFTQDFNYLYYQSAGTGAAPSTNLEINTIHVAKKFYMARSQESSDGVTNRVGEPAASVASTLYSPGDLAMASLEIVGDPDWIAQSEIFYGVDKTNNNPFEDDGSVNYNASPVYFSIEWNTPADYNYETGLQEIGKNNQYRKQDGSVEPAIQLAYQANTIRTRLSQGRFTQVLEGTLQQWIDDPSVTRVDQGFAYDPNKRATQVNQSLAAVDSKYTIDAVDAETQFAMADVAEVYSTSSVSEQTYMLAQQEAEFWEEDTAYTDAPTANQTLEQDDDDEVENFNNDQYGLARVETAAAESDSTQPTFTNVAPVNPNSTSTAQVKAAANPNTMTQNTITKTGGDKTVTQTPTFQEFAAPAGTPATVYRVGDVYEEREPITGDLIRYEVLRGNIHEPAAIYNPATGQWEEY